MYAIVYISFGKIFQMWKSQKRYSVIAMTVYKQQIIEYAIFNAIWKINSFEWQKIELMSILVSITYFGYFVDEFVIHFECWKTW